MITNKLRELLATHLKSLVDGGSGQVGFGGNSTNPFSNTLDVPSSVPVSIQSANSDENVIEIKASIDGSNVTGRVLRELGLFDSSSNMLSRVNFEGIGPFSSSETIEFFIIIEVE
jgi:hypothetical protein